MSQTSSEENKDARTALTSAPDEGAPRKRHGHIREPYWIAYSDGDVLLRGYSADRAEICERVRQELQNTGAEQATIYFSPAKRIREDERIIIKRDVPKVKA